MRRSPMVSWIAVFILVAGPVLVAPVVGTASAAAATSGSSALGLASHQGLQDAIARAKAQGSPVEVTALDSPTTTTWANPDGSRTAKVSSLPTRWRGSGGAWHDIDTTLAAQADGTLQPVSFDPARRISIPERGDGAAHVMTAAGDFLLTHPGAGSISSTHGRNRGHFKGALGGLDLDEDVTVNGLEESVTLTTAAQPAAYTDVLTVPSGVTARQGVDGVEFLNSDGKRVGSFGGGGAHDSLVTASGDPAGTSVQSSLVSQRGLTVTIRVSVDKAWLRDPARVFPVVIDPQLYANTSQAGSADWWSETDGVYNKSNLDQSVLRVGYGFGTNGARVARSELLFGLTAVPLGAQVTEAHMVAYNTASSSCTLVPLVLSGNSSFSQSSAMPSNDGLGPISVTSLGEGPSGACNPGWVQLDATALAQRWLYGQEGNNGIILQSNESTTGGWKKFYSGTTGSNTAPALYINYNDPATPVVECITCVTGNMSIDGTPVLATAIAGATNPTFTFRVFDASTAEVAEATVGGSYDPSTGLFTAYWTAPHLPDGGYVYDVIIVDGSRNTNSDFTGMSVLTSLPALTQPASQQVSARYFPIAAASVAGADTGWVQWRQGQLGSPTAVASAPALVGTAPWGATYAPVGGGPAPSGLFWDADQSPGPDYVGQFEVSVCFYWSAQDVQLCTPETTVNKQQHGFGGPRGTASAGPATVSLLTGEMSLTSTDASVPGESGSDVSVSRSFLSLNGSEALPSPFGPGWSAALPTLSDGAAGATLRDNSSIDGTIRVAYPDGEEDDFFQAAKGAGAYAPLGLTAGQGKTFSIASDLLSESMTEADGTKTTWTRPNLSTGWTAPPTVTLPGARVTATPVAAPAFSTTDSATPPAWVSGDGGTVMVTKDSGLPFDCTQTFQAGCHRITVVTAAASTVAPTGANLGAYPNQVRAVLLDTYDPAAGAIKTKVLEQYAYDSGGHLRQAWNPQADVVVGQHLITAYTYTAAGLLASVTPPGLATWNYGYDATNRLTSVSRLAPSGATATTRYVYDVPLSNGSSSCAAQTGTLPDLSLLDTGCWGQDGRQGDFPSSAAAVFPATYTPSTPPVAADWVHAAITYMGGTGYVLNTASFGAGAWQISSTSYNFYGRVASTLTPEDRQQVVAGSGASHTPPLVANLASADDRASLLATTYVYDPSDPAELTDTYGPTHTVTLASGSTAVARAQTHTDYDQGAPASLTVNGVTYTTPFRLPTTVTTKALVLNTTTPTNMSTGTSTDARVTTMGYDPMVSGDGNGWALHQSTLTTTDPGAGLNLKHVTRYDTAGNVVETRLPAGTASGTGVGNDAHSTDTLYYTSGANSVDASCGLKPQWVGLACRVGPAAQPTGTQVPVTHTTGYDWALNTTAVSEQSGAVTRTTTSDYGTTGARLKSTAVTTTGLNAATPIHAKISFEPPGAAVPTGYTADDGEPYSSTLGRGWVRQDSLSGTHVPLDLSQPGLQQSGVSWGNTRDRHRTGVQGLLNTLINMQYADSATPPPAPTAGQLVPGAFEYAVPNGRYTVTVSSGDQAYNSSHTINVEGVNAIKNFVPTSSNEYMQAAVTVNVTDGKVTVDAIGGTNTKLNYVTIDSAANTTVATKTYTYVSTTGQLNTVTNGTKTVTTGHDSWGRVTTYTNGTGDAATSTTYDLQSRPLTRTDGKGTYTYTYEGNDSLGRAEDRGLLTKVDTGMGALPGVFTGAYNGDGSLVSETYPTSITATTTVDDAGQANNRAYTKTGQTWNLAFTANRDINGRILNQTSPLSKQTFTYDQAGRLTGTRDLPTGTTCTSRLYTYDPDSNRTALNTATYAAVSGACGTPPAGTTVSHSYDTADRDTDTGYLYDELGRTLNVPAADATGTPLAVNYDSNDMVATQQAGNRSLTWTTDPTGRLLAQTGVTIGRASTTTTVTTNHYSDSSDSPAWIDTGSAWTRNVQGLDGGLAAIQSSDGTGALQLSDLRGNIAAATVDSTTATTFTALPEATEFGVPRTTGAPQYDWHGAQQRSTADLGGFVLMGARLYDPASGRFLSVDPVSGGSCNDYDYTCQDPINLQDTAGTHLMADGGDGSYLSPDDIAANPNLLQGLNPQDLKDAMGGVPSGYTESPGKGSSKMPGWKITNNSRGNLTIRWGASARSGHNDGAPYWTVSRGGKSGFKSGRIAAREWPDGPPQYTQRPGTVGRGDTCACGGDDGEWSPFGGEDGEGGLDPFGDV